MKYPIILNVETSTNICSVAVSEGAKCIFNRSNSDGMNHAALLSLFIDEALSLLKLQSKNLCAVAVSSGPGSYTGLRIGASTAKGLCYGLNIPLMAINTLELLTKTVIQSIDNVDNNENALFCPMIDARRMEVYTAVYDRDLSIYSEISADIINSESFNNILNDKIVYFFGNGAEKCIPFINHKNALFIENVVPLAEHMSELALNRYNEKRFEDVAYFEPFYLKEFQGTTPKKAFLT